MFLCVGCRSKTSFLEKSFLGQKHVFVCCSIDKTVSSKNRKQKNDFFEKPTLCGIEILSVSRTFLNPSGPPKPQEKQKRRTNKKRKNETNRRSHRLTPWSDWWTKIHLNIDFTFWDLDSPFQTWTYHPQAGFCVWNPFLRLKKKTNLQPRGKQIEWHTYALFKSLMFLVVVF